MISGDTGEDLPGRVWVPSDSVLLLEVLIEDTTEIDLARLHDQHEEEFAQAIRSTADEFLGTDSSSILLITSGSLRIRLAVGRPNRWTCKLRELKDALVHAAWIVVQRVKSTATAVAKLAKPVVRFTYKVIGVVNNIAAFTDRVYRWFDCQVPVFSIRSWLGGLGFGLGFG